MILIGGETEKKFADPGSTEYTAAVEELDLSRDTCRVIGRISGPRAYIIAERLDGDNILLVGGWHESSIGDERWYRGAEIFKVPPAQSSDGKHADQGGS